MVFLAPAGNRHRLRSGSVMSILLRNDVAKAQNTGLQPSTEEHVGLSFVEAKDTANGRGRIARTPLKDNSRRAREAKASRASHPVFRSHPESV